MKTFCYSPNCKAVKTGFRFNDYLVCTYCKCEVNEQLFNRIIEQEKKKEVPKKEDDYERDDIYDLMQYNANYVDPLGDV